MKLATTKIIPKLLNFKQKQHRKDNAQEMLMTINDDSDLLKNVITVDESRVDDFETKAQSSQKITSISVKCEGFAHCFLQLQWRGAS